MPRHTRAKYVHLAVFIFTITIGCGVFQMGDTPHHTDVATTA